MRNRSLKSEFIGVHFLSSNPVVSDEFPSRLTAFSTREGLPVENLLAALLIE
jgi:hypothetical protein